MASSTTFSSFANDILFEIFIYLPLTSIYKFKSVSKVWFSLLSNHNFITKWIQINSKSLPWIQYHTIDPYYHDSNQFRFGNAYPDSNSQFISSNNHGFSFEFLRNEKLLKPDELILLGSSNGLVLCSSWKGPGKFHVCNPLTRKWVSLPSAPCRLAGHYDYNGILCGNPLSASCCYKVVCINIPRFMSSKKFNVDMFESDLGDWRSFEVSCDQNISEGFEFHKNVITFNGVLFFLDESDRMLVYNPNQNNGSNEHRCDLINLPGPAFASYELVDEYDTFNGRTLCESEGHICYARTRVTGRKITVSVWMLEEDNWRILHKDILVQDTLAEICFRTCRGEKVKVSGLSPIDQNVVLLGCGHSVWWYNIQTQNFEELGHSSLLANRDTGVMCESFVLKTMPTILRPPTWVDEDEDLPSKYSHLNNMEEDDFRISKMFLFE